MEGANLRRYSRLTHRAKIRIKIMGSPTESLLEMKDFSEGGLYLLNPSGVSPELGAIIEVQTTELEDAPIQAARVVRVEDGVGFGVEFISSASDMDI